jgi:hypothetical protein
MKKLLFLCCILFGMTLMSACSKSHTKFTVLGFELDIQDKEEEPGEFEISDKL